MPHAPLKPCPKQGCRALIHRKARWCEPHAMQEMAMVEAARPTSTGRGYGAAWRRLRLAILRRDPICRACNVSASEEVDHIVPKKRGGQDTMENLQGLCKPCHSRKTALEDGRWSRRENYSLRCERGRGDQISTPPA